MNRVGASKWPPFLLLAVATLLVWGHTVTFDFVWDDIFFIRDLPSVRSLKNVPEMFYRIEAQATDPYKFRVFRPIRTAHYALLHWLCGQAVPQPWIYHLANVLWHGATAMMLFASACLLLRGLGHDWPEAKARFWALVVALGFALHPVVSEVVCWSKGLDDILAAFFTLASLRELLKPGDGKSARWLAMLFFALAVYSKESAVPFAFIPLVILRHVHGRPWKESARRTASFLLIAAIYMLHRRLIIGRNSQTDPLSETYLQTLVDMLPVALKYFRLLWGIPPFFIDYKYLHGGHALLSPEVFGGLALLAALAVAGVLAWRNPGLKPVGFGLLWTGLFLLPVSNLLPMMQYLAERFLYLPLIGWLIAVMGLAAILPRGRLLYAALLFLLLPWGVAAWQRSWIWKDELTLFVRSYLEGPPAPRVEHNAVAAILNLPHVSRVYAFDDATDRLTVRASGDEALQQEVLRTFAQAFPLFPENHVIVCLYGISLANTGQPEKAVLLFEKATRLKPKNGDYWLNLARAALSTGQLAKARLAAGKAAALAPDNPLVLSFQVELELQTRNYAEAREILLQLQRVAPSEANARLLLEIETKSPAENTR